MNLSASTKLDFAFHFPHTREMRRGESEVHAGYHPFSFPAYTRDNATTASRLQRRTFSFLAYKRDKTRDIERRLVILSFPAYTRDEMTKAIIRKEYRLLSFPAYAREDLNTFREMEDIFISRILAR